jgi:hypothetical protein
MSRAILKASAGAVLLLVLSGAALMAGRLLNRGPLESGPVVLEGQGGAKMVMMEEPDVEYAAELPDRPPDIAGLFGRREDNNLFVRLGNIMTNVKRDDHGNVELETRADGPEVEVIVTHDTLIYRDDTHAQFGPEVSSGPIQQVLNPGSLDEVGQHSQVLAWGIKRGDRTVAEVLVYVIPAVLRR